MPRIHGARVLELGTGLGVLSILVAALLEPSEVLATDGDAETVAAAAANVEENLGESSRVTVKQLSWGDPAHISSVLRTGGPKDADTKFNLVLGSDITYYPAPLNLLEETILELTEVSGTVIIAHRNRSRSVDPPFFSRLASHFETCKVSSVADAMEAGRGGGSIIEDSTVQVHVFQNRLASPSTECE